MKRHHHEMVGRGRLWQAPCQRDGNARSSNAAVWSPHSDAGPIATTRDSVTAITDVVLPGASTGVNHTRPRAQE